MNSHLLYRAICKNWQREFVVYEGHTEDGELEFQVYDLSSDGDEWAGADSSLLSAKAMADGMAARCDETKPAAHP